MAAQPASVHNVLAPSELVYFHAGAFAREKKLVDAVGLVHSDAKHDASELGAAILATALLSAEQAGAVVLELGKASRLFGLRKADALVVKPGVAQPSFPPGSFEAGVRPVVDAAKGQVDAERVFTALLREDAPDPYSWAVMLAARGLAERRLFETEEVRKLKVFRTQVYHVPQATRDLVAQTSPDGPRDLLARTQRDRPEVWRLLNEGLKRAVSSRTEHDSGDGPD